MLCDGFGCFSRGNLTVLDILTYAEAICHIWRIVLDKMRHVWRIVLDEMLELSMSEYYNDIGSVQQ